MGTKNTHFSLFKTRIEKIYNKYRPKILKKGISFGNSFSEHYLMFFYFVLITIFMTLYTWLLQFNSTFMRILFLVVTIPSILFLIIYLISQVMYFLHHKIYMIFFTLMISLFLVFSYFPIMLNDVFILTKAKIYFTDAFISNCLIIRNIFIQLFFILFMFWGTSVLFNSFIPQKYKNFKKHRSRRSVIKLVILIVSTFIVLFLKKINNSMVTPITIFNGILMIVLTPKNYLMEFSNIKIIDNADIKQDIQKLFLNLQIYISVITFALIVSIIVIKNDYLFRVTIFTTIVILMVFLITFVSNHLKRNKWYQRKLKKWIIK